MNDYKDYNNHYMMEFINSSKMVFVSRNSNDTDDVAYKTKYKYFLNVVDTTNVSAIKLS
jgi:chitodextrinase